MEVMVVGGADSLVYGNFGRKLQGHGVTVRAHVPYKDGNSHRSVEGIPKSCDGVIIILDMVSHATCAAAKEAARRQNLPVVEVPRKFSLAEPHLRAHGILPAVNGSAPARVTQDEIMEIALPHVLRVCESGRRPSLPEIETLVQRAFGADKELHRATFDKVVGMAMARTRPLPVDAVVETTTTLILMQPDLILDRANLATEVASIGSWGLTADILSPVVNRAADELRTKWATTRSQGEADRRQKVEAVREWLVSLWRAYAEGKRPYPDTFTLKGEAKAIFTSEPHWDLVRETRCRVLGAWADKLIDANLLARSYKDIPEFRTLLETGAIRSVVSLGKRLTSRLAVEAYLKAQQPVPPPVLPVDPLDARIEALVAARIEQMLPEIEARITARIEARLGVSRP